MNRSEGLLIYLAASLSNSIDSNGSFIYSLVLSLQLSSFLFVFFFSLSPFIRETIYSLFFISKFVGDRVCDFSPLLVDLSHVC